MKDRPTARVADVLPHHLLAIGEMTTTDWQKHGWTVGPDDNPRPIVRVRVLGGFRAQYRESIWELGSTRRDVPGAGQRQWEYFALLAGWPSESVHADLVASALWPGTTR
jgi:hypothetical protein